MPPKDPPHESNRRFSARRWRFLPFLTAWFLLPILPASGFAGSSSGAATGGTLAYTKISFSYGLSAISPYQWTVSPLLMNSAPSRHPVPSPDGSAIAFVSTRADGRWSIYLSSSDGKNVRGIPSDPGLEALAPRWSPDGRRIIFFSRGNGESQIRTIGVDGTDEQIVGSGTHDSFPDYAPDGTRIVFERETNGKPDIWLMNADGSNPVQIMSNPERDLYPVWSPDGNWIAFCRAGTSAMLNIWVVHPDSTGLTDLTPDLTVDADVSWATDSKSLIYSSFSTDHIGVLFSVPVTGGTPTPIGSAEDDQRDFPSMSRDGRIFFDVYSNSAPQAVCVRARVGNNCYGRGGDPVLSPDGTRLLFVRDGRLWLAPIGFGKPMMIGRVGWAANPTWAPDGRSIAFIGVAGTKLGLFTLDLRGHRKPRRLLTANQLCWPSWGTNGLIAYTDFSRGSGWSVWVIKPNGRGKRPLLSTSAENWQATWSPDGRSIAFLSDRSGLEELYVRSNGGPVRALTSDRQLKNAPFWSPDGKEIGYTQSDGVWGDQRLFVVPASGGAATSLFRIPELVDQGSWRR